MVHINKYIYAVWDANLLIASSLLCTLICFLVGIKLVDFDTVHFILDTIIICILTVIMLLGIYWSLHKIRVRYAVYKKLKPEDVEFVTLFNLAGYPINRWQQAARAYLISLLYVTAPLDDGAGLGYIEPTTFSITFQVIIFAVLTFILSFPIANFLHNRR